MTKDEFIRAVAELLAALQFPVSLPETMKENLIVAEKPWVELHRGLHGFGWATAGDYEEAIRWTLES
jgi:hypothetical protein